MPTKINININNDTLYRELFGSVMSGSSYVLEAFPSLYQRAHRDLAGTFSTNELKLIIDIMRNGHLLTPGLAGQHIALAVSDAIDLDGLDKKMGVDKTVILQKLACLPSFSRACLEIWAVAYCEPVPPHIGEYVGPLASDMVA